MKLNIIQEMGKITEKCPHCGNYVEGKKVKSYQNKVARQGAKNAVHMVTGVGAASIGAEIGTAIFPGVGTVIGAGIGFLGSAMFNQKVNEKIDKVGDGIEDEFLLMNYEFTCPKCGHSWIHDEYEAIIGTHDDNFNDGDNKNEMLPMSETDRICNKYEYLCREVFMHHYCMSVISSQPKKNIDYKAVTIRVSKDIGHSIYDWQIKADSAEAVCEKLEELVYNKLCYEDFDWYGLIKTLPHGNSTDNYFMKVYNTCCLDGYGDLLIGVNISGFISVGDTIVLCTDDNEYYKAEVTWIELNGKQFSFSESGDALGMGISVDLETVPGDVIGVLKYDEFVKADEEQDNSIGDELSSEEQEYINELKDVLSDGEISARERRLLEKIRIKFDISEERAAELEASLSALSLTPEEQEYLNEYKEIIADGEISPRERRLLDKLKKVNGISDERAKEIEGYNI